MMIMSALQDDMFTPDVIADPYTYYGRLRDEDPVHWNAISLGELADIVREFILDARISFDKEPGGRELSGNYSIDNTRLVSEFGVQYRPYRERVLQIINDIRKDEGLPQLGPQ